MRLIREVKTHETMPTETDSSADGVDGSRFWYDEWSSR